MKPCAALASWWALPVVGLLCCWLMVSSPSVRPATCCPVGVCPTTTVIVLVVLICLLTGTIVMVASADTSSGESHRKRETLTTRAHTTLHQTTRRTLPVCCGVGTGSLSTFGGSCSGTGR